MADQADNTAAAKADLDAQKAYEAAAANVKTVAAPAPAAPVLEADAKAPVVAKPAPVKPAAEKVAANKQAPAKETAPKKVAAKAAPKKTAKKTAAKTPKKAAAKKRKPATSKLAVATANLATKNSKKETIMTQKSNAKTAAQKADAKKLETVASDLTKTVKETATNAQSRVKDASETAQARLKSAYGTTSKMASEATEFTKGNVEAVVESGKILASGMQNMGRDAFAGSKAAVETMSSDAKAFAAVRSPTDLFKLQGEIARRNFDTMVSTTSSNTKKMVKLASESFAPISNRVSLAAEKVSKAA